LNSLAYNPRRNTAGRMRVFEQYSLLAHLAGWRDGVLHGMSDSAWLDGLLHPLSRGPGVMGVRTRGSRLLRSALSVARRSPRLEAGPQEIRPPPLGAIGPRVGCGARVLQGSSSAASQSTRGNGRWAGPLGWGHHSPVRSEPIARSPPAAVQAIGMSCRRALGCAAGRAGSWCTGTWVTHCHPPPAASRRRGHVCPPPPPPPPAAARRALSCPPRRHDGDISDGCQGPQGHRGAAWRPSGRKVTPPRPGFRPAPADQPARRSWVLPRRPAIKPGPRPFGGVRCREDPAARTAPRRAGSAGPQPEAGGRAGPPWLAALR
jgi:hypothetical protein